MNTFVEYAPDCFTDILYVFEGQQTHILFAIVPRWVIADTFPKQALREWPTDEKHKFEVLCGNFINVGKGVADLVMLDKKNTCFCKECIDRLPMLLCDKAINDLVGVETSNWLHTGSLYQGLFKPTISYIQRKSSDKRKFALINYYVP